MIGGYVGYYFSGAYAPIEASATTSFESATSSHYVGPVLNIPVVNDFVVDVSLQTEISSVGEASFIENLSLDSAVDMLPIAV